MDGHLLGSGKDLLLRTGRYFRKKLFVVYVEHGWRIGTAIVDLRSCTIFNMLHKKKYVQNTVTALKIYLVGYLMFRIVYVIVWLNVYDLLCCTSHFRNFKISLKIFYTKHPLLHLFKRIMNSWKIFKLYIVVLPARIGAKQIR